MDTLRTQQLQASHRLSRAIVESAADAIVATDDDDRIVLFNSAAERMFRCEAAIAIGQAVDRFVLSRSIDDEGSERFVAHALRRDGALVTADATRSDFEIDGRPARAIVLRESVCPLRELTNSLNEQAKRISHALHDEAAQFLAAAHLAVAEVARDVPAPARRRLEEVRMHLNRIEDEFRRIAHELRPQILDDLGLVPAIEFLADSMKRRWGLAVTIDALIEHRLPPHVEIAVYRMTQEAFTNASKHAQATRLSARFGQTSRLLCCAIEDDGVGFDSREVRSRAGERGFGLIGLHDQVRALGGALLVKSAPGRGTKVMAMIPLGSAPPCR